MSDETENPGISRRRRKRRSYALLILAAGIFLFGAGLRHAISVAAANHLADCSRPARQRRPETGPDPRPNLCPRRKSDPARAGHDGRSRGKHRAVRGIEGRSRGRARRSQPAGKRRIRRHPAQERGCAVGAIRPSGERFEEKAGSQDQRHRRTRRTSRRRHRQNPGPTSPCCA